MDKQIFKILFVALSFTFFISCNQKKVKDKKDTYVADNYSKQEVDILMRDGVKLHTTIYTPIDNNKKYPILLQRTPYSSAPYGEGK